MFAIGNTFLFMLFCRFQESSNFHIFITEMTLGFTFDRALHLFRFFMKKLPFFEVFLQSLEKHNPILIQLLGNLKCSFHCLVPGNFKVWLKKYFCPGKILFYFKRTQNICLQEISFEKEQFLLRFRIS